MNLSFLFAPLPLTIIAIIGVAIIFRATIDIIQWRERRKIIKILRLNKEDKKQTSTFSIVCMPTESLEHVASLISSIDSSQHIEIVLIIEKQSILSPAAQKLRRSTSIPIRIIRLPKSPDKIHKTIKRYARNELIIFGDNVTTISRDTLSRISRYFSISHVNKLAMRRWSRLDSRLTSVALAWMTIAAHSVHRGDRVKIVRKDELTNNSPQTLLQPTTLFCESDQKTSEVSFSQGLLSLMILYAVGLFVVIVYYVFTVTWYYPFAAALAAILWISASELVTNRFYTFYEKSVLILALPLVPVVLLYDVCKVAPRKLFARFA